MCAPQTPRTRRRDRARQTGCLGVCMSKGGIDHAGIGNARDQFLRTDPGEKLMFRQQPVVGGIVEIEDLREVLGVVRNPGKNALFLRTVFRLDETVGVAAAHSGNGNRHRTRRTPADSRWVLKWNCGIVLSQVSKSRPGAPAGTGWTKRLGKNRRNFPQWLKPTGSIAFTAWLKPMPFQSKLGLR